MGMSNEELEAVQKDKDYIRNYLRQLNPGKKQPTQGSFKPQPRNSNQVAGGSSGDGGSSLMMSNVEVSNQMGTGVEGDYNVDSVLGMNMGSYNTNGKG